MSVTLLTSRSTAWHEAAHAAALVSYEWVPLAVRIDMPGRNLAGSTTPDWNTRDIDAESMGQLLVAVLCAPISDGTLVDDWPICPDDWAADCHADAEMACFIAGWLGQTQAHWGYSIYKAASLTRERRYRTLQVEIANRLQDVELVLQPELVAIAEGIPDD